MVNQELVDYFKKYEGQYPVETLKQGLINKGFSPQDVDEAAAAVGPVAGPAAPSPSPAPGSATPAATGSAQMNDMFIFDEKTKETVVASIIGLAIAEIIMYFGWYLVGSKSWFDLIYTALIICLGGLVSGWVLSKLYDRIMTFISTSLKFLMPLVNTFFKVLFVPVVIGAIFSLLGSLLLGGAIMAIGAGYGGAGGGIIGGFIGGSIIFYSIWLIVVTLIARFIYAKWMVSKVGKYYKDYKNI